MTRSTCDNAAPNIRVSGLSRRYTKHGPAIIDALDVEFPAGEFSVILGPSGCGKSTLLRLVAGLDSPDAGSIHIGGVDVTRRPPSERHCAMVFQNYALYPHMTVEDNIGYGLKLAGIGREERSARVQAIASTLGLHALLGRKPGQLSGGQRQRVAIGRALVRKPPVLLFDEPLCNLDSGLRQEMRTELRRIHQDTGATVLYVTHDQTEAMTLADRVVVLNKGRVEQIDTPHALYKRPHSIVVARFFGSTPMNLIEVIGSPEGVLTLGDGQVLPLKVQAAMATSGPLFLGIRAENLKVASPGVSATVHAVEELGSHRVIHCRVAGQPVLVSQSDSQPCSVGSTLNLWFPADEALLFDGASGQRISSSLVQDNVSL
ncbi:ABC transporter ATP-binding protein [Pseudomonas sp. Leaf59]|uniref:ABC transporter ATP-binding protein n=1 Tax=Pseudomonas sp. Leaf59 TaxID=2876556 RepID=UPI001E608929|nr:ATP-binding cassette domain-containing protein [Pseudomonas sp. Leaf59]